MKRSVLAVAASLAALACAPTSACAQAPTPISFQTSGVPEFDSWREDFSARAIAAGHDRSVVQAILEGTAPDQHIIDLDHRQPEFVAPVWDYVNAGTSQTRIANGIALKASLGPTLQAIQQRYGVDSDIILGIWGLESNYGGANLPYDAPDALATLAFEGRRRAQFEGYLLALMQMVERGLATKDQLRSSWAGALGQPQFMPDVYLSMAVDWNGDGKRDIWTDNADIAASIAHYLQDRGWQAGQPVFDEVRLPAGFDFSLADGSTRSVADWDARGVHRIDGSAWSDSDRTLQSQLWLPAGATGPALLLHPNFAVIRRYNNSDRYALVVCLLARGFEGRGGLVAPWPTNLASLNRDQTFELQTLLNSLGYAVGTPDGLFGSNTRRGVRQYQVARNLPADGFPTLTLLSAIRAQAGVSAPDPEPEEVRALRTGEVRQLQRILNRLGYHAGRADGSIGPATRQAIRTFQRRHHLDVTGRATSDVLDAARHARR